MSNETVSARPMISLVVGLFALVGILVALAVGKETGTIDPMLAKRGVAICIGLIMMATANQLPKLLPPARNRDSGPFTGMSPERFAGWTFVLAGVVYVAVLAIAPIDVAMPLAAVVGLIAFAIAGVNWAAAVLGASARVHPEAETIPQTGSENSSFEAAKRLVLINLFFSFFWVFATFLADSIWGDRVSQPMAIVWVFVFIAGNAILPQFVNPIAGNVRSQDARKG